MSRPIPQTRPRPENTAHLIDDGSDDEFSDLRTSTVNDGLLAGLARLFGKPIEHVKAAISGHNIAAPDYPVTDCRECGKEFRIFEKQYGKKQIVCPACDDEQMRSVREAAMRPEKLKAERLMKLQEESAAQKKAESQRETIELVAQTVAQVLAENKAAKT